MKNPLSSETRAKVYLAGDILSMVLMAVGASLALLGYGTAVAVIGIASGLITKVVSKLARENITTEAEIDAAVEKKVAANVAQDLQFASTSIPRHRAEESSAIG